MYLSDCDACLFDRHSCEICNDVVGHGHFHEEKVISFIDVDLSEFDDWLANQESDDFLDDDDFLPEGEGLFY